MRIPKRTEKWSQHRNTKNQTFLTATRGWLPKDSRIKICEFTGFGCMFAAWFWPLRESIQPHSEIKTASHSFMCKATSSFIISMLVYLCKIKCITHTWVYLIGITAHLNLIPGKFESHLAAALVGALAHTHTSVTNETSKIILIIISWSSVHFVDQQFSSVTFFSSRKQDNN